MAVGMLCVDDSVSSEKWLQELFPKGSQLSEDDLSALIKFFEESKRKLVAEDFIFSLFLPDDEAMLSQQVEALGSWCRGFLFGIGYGYSSSIWPGDSGEILKDIVEFTKLDPNVHDEDDEQAFFEIHEYIKAAVLLLRDDLKGQSHTLH